MMYFIRIVAFVACMVFLSNRFVHIMQLEGYKAAPYMKWLRGNTKKYLPFLLIISLLSAALMVLAIILLTPGEKRNLGEMAIYCLLLLTSIASSVTTAKAGYKKPLVYTHRVLRLFGGVIFVSAVIAAVIVLIPVYAPVLICLLLAAVPLITLLADLVVLPIEKAGQRKYFNMARKKLLSFPNMKRIGITGSYGKTSTKFILGTILSEKYKTYITPQSYNTPMGVSRVINGELTADYEIFVSEMGARHVGDIKEMCDLVNPEYGIITSIGPQHLETFKTIETVASTKYELIEALPEGGHAFFPDDGAYGKACYDKCGTAKTLFGLSPIDGVYASDFSFSYAGCLFTLHDGKGGSIKCRTKLLGQHNIQNITGAAAVALELGLTLEEIAAGIEKIAPVEHRLQIMDTNNGITVIDDSFNSNPVGCKAAMEILKDFPGRHIVITPGLVELGDAEEAENRSFGEAMAKAADIAILVGEKRSRPIKEGLIAAGFDSNNIIIVNSLNEASARLANITQIGDTVLFENDLPDNYDE